jgi:hypothetical protein
VLKWDWARMQVGLGAHASGIGRECKWDWAHAQAGLGAHASGIGRTCKRDRAVLRYVASLKGHHDVVLCLLSAQRGRAAHSPAEAEAEAVGTAAPTVRAKNATRPRVTAISMRKVAIRPRITAISMRRIAIRLSVIAISMRKVAKGCRLLHAHACACSC